MGVPASDVRYTKATTGWGDYEVHKGHVVALAKKNPASASTLRKYAFYFRQRF
jgi:hypothetical protein